MTGASSWEGRKRVFIKGTIMRKFYSKKSMLGVAALLMASATTPAFAEEAESASAITVSGTAAVTSDYRFRGISQSNGNAAVQGSIGVAHDSGVYVGTWGSSIGFAGGTEIDAYAGWSGEVASGLKADVGVLYYYYPNATGASDYFEPYASVSATLGPVEAKVGAAYAFDGQSALANNDNIYVYTDLKGGIPDTPVTLIAHLGYSKGDSALSTLTAPDNDYLDWSLGADYALTEKLTVGVKYTDTDDKPAQKDFTDSSILFTLGVAF
jgi:uncharacterized protein (TIGR02001 family)